MTPTTKEGRIIDFKDLTPELRERVRNTKSPEELVKLAKEEGYELTDEQIENISGGANWTEFSGAPEPKCNEKGISWVPRHP